MRIWLFRMTGWKIFRPARTRWGEATDLWTEADWRWFQLYGLGDPPSPPNF